MKEPSNKTYLAAELAVIVKKPVIAARLATELCRLGRRYLHPSEALCNYPDPGGKRARMRSRVWDKVQAISNDIADQTQLTKPCWFDVDGGGLGLVFFTNPEGSNIETRTALR